MSKPASRMVVEKRVAKTAVVVVCGFCLGKLVGYKEKRADLRTGGSRYQLHPHPMKAERQIQAVQQGSAVLRG